MGILYWNLYWMGFNLYLALLPLFFIWLAYKLRGKIFVYCAVLLWFLYLPNSVYVVTDFEHLLAQWTQVPFPLLPVLVFQYIVLIGVGLWAYLVGFYSFEYRLSRGGHRKLHLKDYLLLIGIHMLIGFAMVLGKVERVNSWEVFSNPERVLGSIRDVVSTPELLFLSILFGLFATFFYFLFRKAVIRDISWLRKKRYHH